MLPHTPTPAAAPVAATPPTMRLSGTLRQRGADFFLDQQLPLDSGLGPVWATPRRYQILTTEATEASALEYLNRPVTVTGSPSYDTGRKRIFVVLATVEPFTTADLNA